MNHVNINHTFVITAVTTKINIGFTFEYLMKTYMYSLILFVVMVVVVAAAFLCSIDN